MAAAKFDGVMPLVAPKKIWKIRRILKPSSRRWPATDLAA